MSLESTLEPWAKYVHHALVTGHRLLWQGRLKALFHPRGPPEGGSVLSSLLQASPSISGVEEELEDDGTQTSPAAVIPIRCRKTFSHWHCKVYVVSLSLSLSLPFFPSFSLIGAACHEKRKVGMQQGPHVLRTLGVEARRQQKLHVPSICTGLLEAQSQQIPHIDIAVGLQSCACWNPTSDQKVQSNKKQLRMLSYAAYLRSSSVDLAVVSLSRHKSFPAGPRFIY